MAGAPPAIELELYRHRQGGEGEDLVGTVALDLGKLGEGRPVTQYLQYDPPMCLLLAQ